MREFDWLAAREYRNVSHTFPIILSCQAMRDNASANTDGPRALRRRSLTRGAWCDADLPPEMIRTILRGDLDRMLFLSTALQVKDRCVVARHDCAIGTLLVKRHTWGNASRTFRMAFREPSARRCARLGLYLHDRGIPTPRPRAYAEHRLGPWSYQSYLISDYVDGQSLYRYIRFGSQTADELEHVAGQVARIWQQLVELGVSHNDMKPENFIVDENRDVWLIDLEKVRIGGKAQRQRARQVFDVQNFLHIRGWHHRAEARAIFANAFLRTAGVDRMALSSEGSAGTDAELSVLILCDGGMEMPLARAAIDSVRYIADEIVLVEAADAGRLAVLKRIDVCKPAKTLASNSKRAFVKSSAAPIVRCPWVLLLRQNECVTPFFAKELQQRIADGRAPDAFRIPTEEQYFGTSLARRHSEIAPVRLFRQPADSIATAEDLQSVTDDRHSAAQLTGTILSSECASIAEFVARLNEESTCGAESRWQRGERARFGRAPWRALRRFFKSYRQYGGILSGWTSLQLAVYKSLFCWIEEAKLNQLGAEFRTSPLAAELEDESSVSLPTQSSGGESSWRAKAA